MEFATESTLRGKYGYALATLQAAVEFLLTVEKPEDYEDEVSDASSSSSSQPMPVRTVAELSETDFLVISHSPLHDDLVTHRIDSAKLAEESDDSRSKRLTRLIHRVDKMHEQKQRDSSETGIDGDLNAAAATPQKKRPQSILLPPPMPQKPASGPTAAASSIASTTSSSPSVSPSGAAPVSPFFNDSEKVRFLALPA